LYLKKNARSNVALEKSKVGEKKKTLQKEPLKKEPLKIGLIAGTGKLPVLLVNALKATRTHFVVVCLEDPKEAEKRLYQKKTQTAAEPLQQKKAENLLAEEEATCTSLLQEEKNVPWIKASLGQVGRVLSFFKKENVGHVMMAGGLERPSLSSLKFDMKGGLWVAKLLTKPAGDDGLLKGVAMLFEKEGLQVISPHTFLSDLLKVAENLSEKTPRSFEKAWIDKGFQVLDALAPFDIGQSLVMQDGRVIGIEGVEGTDALLTRLAPFVKKGKRTFLIKAPKKGQDNRLDLPTLGPQTVENLGHFGYCGVAFEQGGTYLLETEKMTHTANHYGLFIWPVKRGDTFFEKQEKAPYKGEIVKKNSLKKNSVKESRVKERAQSLNLKGKVW